MRLLFTYFGVALGASLVLTALVRAAALRFGLVAKPKEDRWHVKPTALFGGVAIAVPTLVLGATLGTLGVWQLVGCGFVIAAFGFADDFFSLKPSTKLIAQIVVASALAFFGYRLEWTSSLVGDTVLTMFWIVGITNAFNLLDNMDGLCAGTVLVAGGFLLMTLAGQEPLTPAAPYLAALLGSTAGFLVFNFHPATIFMGDTGSLFLGLNIATITLMVKSHGSIGSRLLSTVAAPVLLLLVPILDTTLVTAVRLLSGRKPSQGGRDHTSHRLVQIGLSQRTAVAILWLLAACGGGAAVVVHELDASWAVIVAIALLIGSVLFAIYLARVRVYDDQHFSVLKEGPGMTPVVADFMYKRRVAEVLLDFCLITLAYYTAYHLRFDVNELLINYPYFLHSLPIVVAVQIIALLAVGGYRGTWHQFGMMDAVVFGRGVVLGTIGALVGILYAFRFENYSRAVFVIYAGVLLLLLCGSRASFRLLSEFVQRRRVVGQRCVIYGTGSASLATIREAFGDLPLRIVGFIDDDPQQQGRRLGGYSVLGMFDELVKLIDREEIDCVVLNTRMMDAARLTALEAACQRRSIELLRLHVSVKPVAAVS